MISATIKVSDNWVAIGWYGYLGVGKTSRGVCWAGLPLETSLDRRRQRAAGRCPVSGLGVQRGGHGRQHGMALGIRRVLGVDLDQQAPCPILRPSAHGFTGDGDRLIAAPDRLW